jgi:hypothetical protein
MGVKQILITSSISLIVLALVLFYNFAETNGENKCTIQILKKTNEIQKENSNTQKFQQEILSNTTDNGDAAYRRQFLQLVFKERASSDK